MKLLITGADGFIGRNLRLYLSVRPGIEVFAVTRADDEATLAAKLKMADFVVHLAGVNRPQSPEEFLPGNAGLTEFIGRTLADHARETGRKVPVVYASSSQAALDNAYGNSKRAAESALQTWSERAGFPIYLFRLPNVFGKWCKPNYNSAVATFCHNISRGLPIQINDSAAPLKLVYVDDVIQAFTSIIEGVSTDVSSDGFCTVQPEYSTTVGEVAAHIQAFRGSRDSLVTPRVGTGLVRALYATYVSYLPTSEFSYRVAQHADPRGVFVEMLKTPDAGQFSYFTAHPGVTRGGHFHHTKTEKFLVIRGTARFKFRNMDSNEFFEMVTSGDQAEIVETVPGWTHDITNIGEEEMIVMLWANEVFDRSRPDTYTCPV